MPNWCYNNLSVLGPAEDRKQFLKAIEDGSDYRLAKLVPMPIELEGTESPTPKSPEPHPNWTESLAKGEITQEWHDELVARNIERYKAGQVALAATGYTDWYAWANDVWGTKWGDCDTEFTEHDSKQYEFRYRTAWGPFADSFWGKVTAQYPTLSFIISCTEESNAFLACWAYANGEQVYFEETELPYSELFEHIEDDEERWEKINDWEYEWIDARTAEAFDAILEPA